MGPGIGAVMSARAGGISPAPFDAFNVGDHVGDDPAAVAANRQQFAEWIGVAPVWMRQVHGNRVLRLRASAAQAGEGAQLEEADGALCTEPGVACAVMVADCLPILLAAPGGGGVAALHAGWRGLCGAGDMAGHGIAEAGVAALCEAASCESHELRAWLGPCIGPQQFEVGADVLAGFGVDAAMASARFRPRTARDPSLSPKWLADLPGLAHDRLLALGLRPELVSAAATCTVSESSRFFSFRRDAITGRQVACIWVEQR
jgi:YfiH family protein